MIDMNERTLADVIEVPQFVRALRRGIEAFTRYRAFMPLAPRAYTRTLLEKTDEYEVIAMLWAPGSVSPIHDHGDSRCWVIVLEGSLDVENYDRLDEREPLARLRHSGTAHFEAGALDHRLTARELHRVRNLGEIGTYSLQLYAKPLGTFTIVDDLTGLCRAMQPHYDAVVDL